MSSSTSSTSSTNSLQTILLITTLVILVIFIIIVILFGSHFYRKMKILKRENTKGIRKYSNLKELEEVEGNGNSKLNNVDRESQDTIKLYDVIDYSKTYSRVVESSDHAVEGEYLDSSAEGNFESSGYLNHLPYTYNNNNEQMSTSYYDPFQFQTPIDSTLQQPSLKSSKESTKTSPRRPRVLSKRRYSVAKESEVTSKPILLEAKKRSGSFGIGQDLERSIGNYSRVNKSVYDELNVSTGDLSYHVPPLPSQVLQSYNNPQIIAQPFDNFNLPTTTSTRSNSNSNSNTTPSLTSSQHYPSSNTISTYTSYSSPSLPTPPLPLPHDLPQIHSSNSIHRPLPPTPTTPNSTSFNLSNLITNRSLSYIFNKRSSTTNQSTSNSTDKENFNQFPTTSTRPLSLPTAPPLPISSTGSNRLSKTTRSEPSIPILINDSIQSPFTNYYYNENEEEEEESLQKPFPNYHSLNPQNISLYKIDSKGSLLLSGVRNSSSSMGENKKRIEESNGENGIMRLMMTNPDCSSSSFRSVSDGSRVATPLGLV